MIFLPLTEQKMTVGIRLFEIREIANFEGKF